MSEPPLSSEPRPDVSRSTVASDIKHGLPMVSASDPEALAREKAYLLELSGKPWLPRWAGYMRLTGPGWLQSAMTLGGGSAAASLTIGAMFGYKMLWLQPVAMLLGVIMLSAMSHQTLSTQARAFGAMKKYTLAWIGWAWALASLLATVIWHFPQYALAAGMGQDMIHVATGWNPTGGAETLLALGIGVVVLAVSILVTWNYGSGRRGIRLYEKALKIMVAMIIIAFAVVVVRASVLGRIPWGRVFAGFVPAYLPSDEGGVTQFMGALGAAVGINMTFLFPYSLLARGWGREHRGLARFDLITGMLIPFIIATSLMSIATAATLYDPADPVSTKLNPVVAAQGIGEIVGASFGRIIFGLGVLGMVLSSIITHMLACGFAACEMFNIEPHGRRYRLACLIPIPGMLGVVLWAKMGMYVAVYTSAICGVLLPIAYIAFAIMQNRRAFLGEDKPTGGKAVAWNVGMGAAIAAILASIGYWFYSREDITLLLIVLGVVGLFAVVVSVVSLAKRGRA